MPASPVALSRLEAGWTGSITVTNDTSGLSLTVTPDERTSAASAWESLVLALTSTQGAPAMGWIDTALKLVVETPLAAPTFTLTATGTTKTRLALTGTYAAVRYVETASAIANMLHPQETGSAIDPAQYALGRPAGDGVLGARPRGVSASGSVELYDTALLANMITLEAELDDGETYDVFVNGRVLSRFRADTVARKRWGIRATLATVQVGANTVAL